MKTTNRIAAAMLVIGLLAPAGAWAQGRGHGAEKKAERAQPAAHKEVRKQQGPQKERVQAARGAQKQHAGKAERQERSQRPARAAVKERRQDQRATAPARSARERARAGSAVRTAEFRRDVAIRDLRPSVRRLIRSSRAPERMAGAALAHAYARGIDDDALVVLPMGERLRVKNRHGDLLLDIDERRARDLGHWDVRPLGDEVRSGAPSFCRSGEGHPVWGRQWCIDKGFGLGTYRDLRWGRSTSIGDIIFGRRLVDRETLLRDALVATVGNVVLDRLGLHALTLGYTEPLTGTYVVESTGPQVLFVNAGPEPVAEIVDLDRDGRADMMVFALRPW